MAIIGIESLVYAAPDPEQTARFFDDFGLRRDPGVGGAAGYRLPEGSRVEVRDQDDPSLPASSLAGPGVREVIWGVDTPQALERLAADLSRDHDLDRDDRGVIRFTPAFGVPMGLKVFSRTPVVCAPEPGNAPGHLVRLNQHRRWRQRALPKGIAHVVFAIPDHAAGASFMRERLGFRLTDEQVGFGLYLRADGSTNHHNLLLLNASAPLPDMDGLARFHHANFVVEDLDEIMVGANHMSRRGWEPSHFGLGRHRIDSALFYYLPCPGGGEAEYGADSDCVDDAWVPRRWPAPLFAYAHFVHDLPPFLREPPPWTVEYMTDAVEVLPAFKGDH